MQDNVKLQLNFRDGILRARVSGEIDHHTAKELRAAIDSALAEHSPDKLTVDLSGITFMDSSGLGLIMGRFRATQSAGIGFSVCGVPPRAMTMFTMAGLERLIDFEEDNNE